MKALLVLLTVFGFFYPSFCVAEPALTQSQKDRLDSFIETVITSGSSGVAKALVLSQSTSASITPEKMTSRATGQICNDCSDFCRRFTVTVGFENGFSTLIYAGQKCVASPTRVLEGARWISTQPLMLVKADYRVDPATMQQLRQGLGGLLYLEEPSSASSQSVLEALDEFRQDAALGQSSGQAVTQADLTALNLAVVQLHASSTCPRPQAGAIACGQTNLH